MTVKKKEKKEMRNYIAKESAMGKNRYLELLYYTKQYKEWEKELKRCGEISAVVKKIGGKDGATEDRASKLRKDMEKVEQVVIVAAPEFYKFLLINITEGTPYEYIAIEGEEPPCGRRMFYKQRKVFFCLLDEIKT